jgi:hypothetical protein
MTCEHGLDREQVECSQCSVLKARLETQENIASNLRSDFRECAIRAERAEARLAAQEKREQETVNQLIDKTARLAAVEEECADLISGKEYQNMQRTLGEVNARLAEAERELHWALTGDLPARATASAPATDPPPTPATP